MEEKGGKEEGGESAQEPNPGRQKSNSAKQNKQRSKNTAARQLKQDGKGKGQTHS